MKYTYLNRRKVLKILPKRKSDTHKRNYGKILLLCGSKGYTGAAALAAMGALRAGAGLVYLCVPESIYAIESTKLTEAIVFSLDDQDGMLSPKSVERIEALLTDMDCVLIGPGLGRSVGTLAVLSSVLKNFEGTVVLDADGINLVAMHKDLLRGRLGPTVITPHEGEFQRLSDTLHLGRCSAAVELAREHKLIVVLKGHQTVITDGVECFINTTGNPGMAVGGSGDVLAGMITAFIGQGIDPLKASAAAVWLHGTAGDLCAKRLGQYGMLPTDMLNTLPRLMK